MPKNLSKLSSIVWCLLASIFMGCDDGVVFHDYSATNGAWKASDTILFTFSPTDTLAKHDLFLHLRNDNAYQFSNIYLITQLTFPDAKVIKDTLQYQMAEADGTWLGTGFTDVKEHKLWYKEGVQFPALGDYTIAITHAMRRNGVIEGVPVLEGVMDLGLSIENNKK